MWGDSSGDLLVYRYDENKAATFTSGAPSISSGNWHHVVITINENGLWKLFLNGVDSTLSNFDPTAFANGVTIELGRDCGSGYPLSNMYYDDFRIYDRVLGQGDIDALYALGEGGVAATPAPADAPYITTLETLATTATGVSGWKMVRFLPACGYDDAVPPNGIVCQYSGDDDFAGTYTLNADTKLETEEWSTGFSISATTEILLTKTDSNTVTDGIGFNKWVYTTMQNIETYMTDPGTDASWIGGTLSVEKTQDIASATNVAMFRDSTQRLSSPWIYSGASNSDDANMVFVENDGYETADASSKTKTDSFDDDKIFAIFVRDPP